jgi:exonuclease SbcC
MMLKRLRVENIRSYEKLDISFEDGVTVVSGVNGSGKSSLLESCFSGLFGSKTLDKDFVLSDMVRKGATKASIILEFEQDGHDYEVEQVFRNDPEKGRATNTKSLLKMDGVILSDQANRSYDAVKSLLNMDEAAYKNCVYIRQGEIDVLINSKPHDRQKMIDDLLQLGKLEEYRERASSSRKGIGRLKRDVGNRIKDIQFEIEKIESSSPVDRLVSLKNRSISTDLDLKILNEKRDRARTLKDDVLKKVSEFKELSSKKETFVLQKEDIAGRKLKAFEQIGSLEKDIGLVKSQIVAQKEQADKTRVVLSAGSKDIDLVISQLDENERLARDTLSTIEGKAAILKNDSQNISQSITDFGKQVDMVDRSILQSQGKIRSIQLDIETSLVSLGGYGEKRKLLFDKLKSLDFSQEQIGNLDEITGLVADQKRILHGKEREISVKLAELRESIQKSEDLLKKGKCPTCGQELAGSSIEEHTHSGAEKEYILQLELSELKAKQEDIELKMSKLKEVRGCKDEIDLINSDEKFLKDKVSNIGKLLEEHSSRISEDEKKKDDLSVKISTLQSSLNELSFLISKVQQDIGSAIIAHDKSRKQLDLARTLSASLIEIDKMAVKSRQLEDKIASIREMIVMFDAQISEKQSLIVEISEKMGDFDISKLESLSRDYATALTNINLEIEKINFEKNDVLKQAGMVEKELEHLSELKNALKISGRKSSYLNAVYSDAEELEAMYIRIRAELRSRNIGALDALINEIFSFMYSNNAYSHIRLDHDYNLTVFGKDGTPLEPKLLSGGERAIFNLVLRCAIYRLLSMGSRGNSKKSTLPPLIMDEPTVFLDRGHVQQLIKLIDMMRDMGVAQILLVSHDESLIDSADHVFVVEKDPIRNNSLIRPQSAF